MYHNYGTSSDLNNAYLNLMKNTHKTREIIKHINCENTYMYRINEGLAPPRVIREVGQPPPSPTSQITRGGTSPPYIRIFFYTFIFFYFVYFFHFWFSYFMVSFLWLFHHRFYGHGACVICIFGIYITDIIYMLYTHAL